MIEPGLVFTRLSLNRGEVRRFANVSRTKQHFHPLRGSPNNERKGETMRFAHRMKLSWLVAIVAAVGFLGILAAHDSDGQVIRRADPKARSSNNRVRMNSSAKAVAKSAENDPELAKKAKADLRQRELNQLARKGGSQMHAIFVHELGRYLSGATAANDLEKQIFAAFSSVPRKSLAHYMGKWNKLPLQERQMINGRHLSNLKASQAVTGPVVTRALNASASSEKKKATIAGVAKMKRQDKRNLGAIAKALQGVKKVGVTRLKCIDETNPEIGNGDEIFATYVMWLGTPTKGKIWTKITKIYKGLSDGSEVAFQPEDMVLWPPADKPNLVAREDLYIAATLWESDDDDFGLFKDILKAVLKVGEIIVKVVIAAEGGGKGGDSKMFDDAAPALEELATTIATVSKDADLIGTDTLTVHRTGQIVNKIGKPQDFFRRSGDGGTYEIRGVRAETTH